MNRSRAVGDKLKPYRRRRRPPTRKMPDEVKAELAERHRRKRLEAHELRLEAGCQSSAAGAWRGIVLGRYVRSVCSRHGAERLKWFADHPVSDIFR